MATVHLVHGYLGSGKSTFARDLATRHNAVLFSIDEWYLRLFTDGTPTPIQDYELLRRLMDMLEDHWPQIVRRGVDVVLDLGFWTRVDRDRARALTSDHRLYWVRTSDATAMERCRARNEEPGANFLIDEAAYRDLKARYEAPADDEERIIVTT